MSSKNYYLVTGLIFTMITFLQLARSLLGWEAVIGGWMVPMWLSWAAVVVAGFLAYQAFKHSQ